MKDHALVSSVMSCGSLRKWEAGHHPFGDAEFFHHQWGIPNSPTSADVRTDEMSKEMREEWMQDAQNKQLGSFGIPGQTSAIDLFTLWLCQSSY